MQITPSDKILFLYYFYDSACAESCRAEIYHCFCVFKRLYAACRFDLYILADMLRFEEIFHTFPNASCRLLLERDYNYDEDCGAFRMDELQGADFGKWEILVDDMIRQYGHRLDSPKRGKRT